MRLLLALCLVLTGLVVAVDTSAYRASLIPSRGSLAVVETGSAALALVPGPTSGEGNAAGTAYKDATGHLHIDFTRGLNGATVYGFGVNQSYRFRRLFEVQNKTATAMRVSVYVPGGGVAGLSAFYGRSPGAPVLPGTQLAGAGGGGAGTYVLGPAGVLYVDVWWNPTTSASTFPFTIRVDATKN